MAFKILRHTIDNPEQQNFVAYVGKEHLMPVAKQMANLLNDPESFIGYERPP